jgi:hypothetical protein
MLVTEFASFLVIIVIIIIIIMVIIMIIMIITVIIIIMISLLACLRCSSRRRVPSTFVEGKSASAGLSVDHLPSDSTSRITWPSRG